MITKRKILFRFKIDKNNPEKNKKLTQELLSDFLEYKKKDKDLKKILNNKKIAFKLEISVYHTRILKKVNGIIITGWSYQEHAFIFDKTIHLLENFLSSKKIQFLVQSPEERFLAGFEDLHIMLDELEEEISEISNSEHKTAASKEIENLLKHIDFLTNHIKTFDDRIIIFLKQYKIKLGYHKTGKIPPKNKLHKQSVISKETKEIKEDFIRHFKKGTGYFDLGMFTDAITEFKTSIDINPEDYKAHSNLGWAYLLSKDNQKAEKHFNTSIKLNGEYIFAQTGLGLSLMHQGKFDRAKDIFSNIIEKDRDGPSSYFALNGLGHIYEKLRMHEEAIKEFEKAISLMPDEIDGHYNLASVFYNMGLYREAIREYEISLSINPKDEKSKNYKLAAEAQICLSDNNLDEAIEKYNMIVETHPKEPMFFNNLGSIYEKKGDYYKAIRMFKKALDINSDYDMAYFNLGYISDKLKQPDKAIEYYKNALRLNPVDKITLNHLAWDYFLLNKYDKAIKYYKKAIEIDPEFTPALNNLGWLYIKTKKYKKAMSIYQYVLDIKPDNAMAYNDLGYLYYKKNMLNKAVIQLNKAINLNNNLIASSYANFHLALVYIEKGLKEDAIKYLKKAIKLKPHYLVALFKLAEIYYEKENYLLAIENFDKCISIDHKSDIAKESKKNIKKLTELLEKETVMHNKK